MGAVFGVARCSNSVDAAASGFAVGSLPRSGPVLVADHRVGAHLIDDRIWLGDFSAAADPDEFAIRKISHVVNPLGPNAERMRSKGARYCTFDIVDAPFVDIAKYFKSVTAWMAAALAADPENRVLVHCVAGVSRSATIMTAFLMRERRLRVHQAFALVQARRTIVEPNPGFRKQLVLWDAHLFGGAPWPYDAQPADELRLCCDPVVGPLPPVTARPGYPADASSEVHAAAVPAVSESCAEPTVATGAAEPVSGAAGAAEAMSNAAVAAEPVSSAAVAAEPVSITSGTAPSSSDLADLLDAADAALSNSASSGDTPSGLAARTAVSSGASRPACNHDSGAESAVSFHTNGEEGATSAVTPSVAIELPLSAAKMSSTEVRAEAANLRDGRSDQHLSDTLDSSRHADGAAESTAQAVAGAAAMPL